MYLLLRSELSTTIKEKLNDYLNSVRDGSEIDHFSVKHSNYSFIDISVDFNINLSKSM
jgi:hypothetical protein